jgi:[ribosomal protein S5]-alanine N-acetyltransferase
MKIDLVRFKPEYFEEFMKWRNQAASLEHNPLKEIDPGTMFKILADAKTDLQMLSRNTDTFEEEFGFRWFIQTEDGRVVGNISLKNISLMMGYGEIGYGIGEEFQCQGIATAAIGELLRRLFSETPLRRIIAIVHEKNFASLRVLEKLGFQKEGLLREHFLLNGSPANEVYLAILKSEYLAKLTTK